MTKNTNTCSICGKKYSGFGNNAAPINQGRCCDMCNDTVVKPARIKLIQENEHKEFNVIVVNPNNTDECYKIGIKGNYEFSLKDAHTIAAEHIDIAKKTGMNIEIQEVTN